MANTNEKIENLMATLNCTYDEAVELVEYDKQVDKGIIKDDPNVEKVKNIVTSPRTEATKRQPKVDNEKVELMVKFKEFLDTFASNVVITNPNRELTFTHANREFKLTVSATRMSKGDK